MAPSGLVCLAADKTGGWSPLSESRNDSPGPQRQITSYADLHVSLYADNWSCWAISEPWSHVRRCLGDDVVHGQPVLRPDRAGQIHPQPPGLLRR